ncbi:MULTISPECIES: FecR family protein [Parabacteroides]|uniref:FecR family protein n=2 Tax=Parabacteroides leei TaxID=2939491 RepID=UPI001E51EAA3|nr:FecR family protein [Parabacteroides goldsteinii]
MEKQRQSSLRTELIKIAAIIALTLGGSLVYQQMQTKQALIPLQTIAVPAGQRINITLPDGTNVWLNARTTIQYPVTFNSSERLVKLDGEAYFDVARNEKVPFIVQTPKYNVEVLGTQFDVESYSDTGKFETTLMEGCVKISSLTDKDESLMLTPNNKAYLYKGKLRVMPVDDYNPYRWREGLICFKNETFASIMKEFEKYYGINIHITNKQVQQYLYTGKFRQTDGVDYALRVLQKDIRFSYQRDDDKHIIYIK